MSKLAAGTCTKAFHAYPQTELMAQQGCNSWLITNEGSCNSLASIRTTLSCTGWQPMVHELKRAVHATGTYERPLS